MTGVPKWMRYKRREVAEHSCDKEKAMADDTGKMFKYYFGPVVYALTLLVAGAAFYTSAKATLAQVPKNTLKIQGHEVQFSAVNTKLDYIEAGVRRLLERRDRRGK